MIYFVSTTLSRFFYNKFGLRYPRYIWWSKQLGRFTVARLVEDLKCQLNKMSTQKHFSPQTFQSANLNYKTILET